MKPVGNRTGLPTGFLYLYAEIHEHSKSLVIGSGVVDQFALLGEA